MASRLQQTANKASALFSSVQRFNLPSVVSARPHSGPKRSVVAMAITPTTVAPEEVGQAANRAGQEAKQHTQPGQEAAMKVKPQWIHPDYKGSGKLSGKVALITGGDSGIGRAVAVHYAREGAAAIVSVYKGGHEDEDAEETKRLVEAEGSKCLNIVADIGDPQACKDVIARTVKEFGQLDILVNNAAEQHVKEDVREIAPEQLQKTFATNIFSMFYLSQEAVNHLKPGSSIINTTSVLGFKGKPVLLDYAATKGAIVAFTKSLSNQLLEKGIRVNGVAPGPIWAPLIPATMGEEVAKVFGQETPMKRMGQPSECAPSFVFLASNLDSSYISGQVLHPNGGVVVN